MTEEECKHIWIDTSNHWFHWNTGKVMCVGRCTKCGREEDIKYSIIKAQKRDFESRNGILTKRTREELRPKY